MAGNARVDVARLIIQGGDAALDEAERRLVERFSGGEIRDEHGREVDAGDLRLLCSHAAMLAGSIL